MQPDVLNPVLQLKYFCSCRTAPAVPAALSIWPPRGDVIRLGGPGAGSAQAGWTLDVQDEPPPRNQSDTCQPKFLTWFFC